MVSDSPAVCCSLTVLMACGKKAAVVKQAAADPMN
jgi:hypothetical protein